MCRIGVCKEQGRSTAGVGLKQELGRSREREREGEGETMMMTTMTTNDDEDHHYQEREIERDIRLPVGQPSANIRLQS